MSKYYSERRVCRLGYNRYMLLSTYRSLQELERVIQRENRHTETNIHAKDTFKIQT